MEKTVEELRKEIKPEDFQNILLLEVERIKNLYHSVYPQGKFLEISIANDFISIFNEYFDNDKEFPINIHKTYY